jgi:biotin transporter BioY
MTDVDASQIGSAILVVSIFVVGITAPSYRSVAKRSAGVLLVLWYVSVMWTGEPKANNGFDILLAQMFGFWLGFFLIAAFVHFLTKEIKDIGHKIARLFKRKPDQT